MTKNKQLLTVIQTAKAMGITRAAVYKKISKGQIAVSKIGNHVFVVADNLVVSDKLNSLISKGIAKTIKEYGETLKLLGKE